VSLHFIIGIGLLCDKHSFNSVTTGWFSQEPAYDQIGQSKSIQSLFLKRMNLPSKLLLHGYSFTENVISSAVVYHVMVQSLKPASAGLLLYL
jgi:hypothetical protein